MKKLILILLLIGGLLNAQALLIYPGEKPELNSNVSLDYTETLTYTSDFSAGVNSWSATRSTGSGNNDAVSDGTTSFDNVYKTYADASASTSHYSRKNTIWSGYTAIEYITFYVYIPSTNTHADGIWFGNAGSDSPTYSTIKVITCKKVSDNSNYGTINGIKLQGIAGYWLFVTVKMQIYSYNEFTIGMMDGASITFTGSNSSSDDIIYIKDFKHYNLIISNWTLSNTNSTNYLLGTTNGLNFVEVTGETKITMTDTLEAGYYKLKVNQDWTQGKLWAYNGTTTYNFPQADGEYTVKIYLPGNKPLVIGCDNNTISTITYLSVR